VRRLRFREHVLASAYDLIGIQELWWPWRRALELESLMLPASRRDCGLALAGRLRMRMAARVHHFRHHAGPDRLKRKGVLTTRVETEDGLELTVHVTHLQAGRRCGSVRAKQVEEILQVVAQEHGPALLMGDFNFHHGDGDDDRSCERLAAAGLDDAAGATGTRPTFTSVNRYVRHRQCHERFDRVFLRSADGVRLEPVEVEVLDRMTPLSDHHPLRVRIEVEA
jgi:endonuclease/exonuclease/phosphatase family metal-dependent hydrolase